MRPGEAYNGFFNPSEVSGYFGLMTETRLDIKCTLFGESLDGPDDNVNIDPNLNPFDKQTEPTQPGGTNAPGTGEDETGDGTGVETDVPEPPKVSSTTAEAKKKK